MTLLDRLAPRRIVATLSVGIARHCDTSKAPIAISDGHASVASLFPHLCLIFEDLTFVVPDTLTSNTGLRHQMRQLLVDTQIMLFQLARLEEPFLGSPFEIGTNVVPSLASPAAFFYESHLYKQRERYSDRRITPALNGTGMQHIHYHAAMFALVNHLLTRALHEYPPRSLELVRLSTGLQLLEHHYASAVDFSAFALLKPEHRGRIPNMVVRLTGQLSSDILQHALNRGGA